MQVDLQHILNYLLLGLAIAGGLVFGAMGGRFIELSFDDGTAVAVAPRSRQSVARPLVERDFQLILQRNLFNSAAVGTSAEQVDLSSQPFKGAEAKAAPPPITEMRLVGTVVAGDDSLALIVVGKKAAIFQLGEEISPQIILTAVERKLVVVSDHGNNRELPLIKGQSDRARLVSRKGKAGGDDGIVPLKDGRWRISRSVADNARSNLNALMRTARVIPEVKNGATVGFKLVELQRGSLLEKIGLRVGDLLVEVNQVELNSPEKALQIFQQVREANNISLGLLRNGKPMTFEYRFE